MPNHITHKYQLVHLSLAGLDAFHLIALPYCDELAKQSSYMWTRNARAGVMPFSVMAEGKNCNFHFEYEAGYKFL